MSDLTQEPFTRGTRLADRYRLEQIVGSGGMAVVWRAADETLGRTVALKVMSDALAADPAYVARFAREARLAASISHPNLVEIYDYSATAARPYLVMEFVPGGTLADRLRDGPLSVPVLLTVCADLLSALGAVHAQGVLHRDVKPANVLIGPDGRARLTDFGVALLQEGTQLTQPGQVVGTLRFIAPELLGGAPPSCQSDLYSLGKVIEAAAGTHPPDEIAAFSAWLCATDPADRPTDAAAALVRLSDVSPTVPLTEPTRIAPAPVEPLTEAPTVVAPERGTRGPRGLARGPVAAGERRLMWFVGSLTGAVVLVVLIIVLGASGGGSPAPNRSRTVSGATLSTAAHPGTAGRMRAQLRQLSREIPAAGGS
ncbi:serine/threonine-protein kinase [Conexibacter sp. DBS9H8]|uniref:serine/threonine-protein kinase n=1 Tax=Conexibacter sp. DBS9H8 TaxID=2937801 RepID=UPI00200CA9C0|nr:serine/threonine-protein kinase [Conexibacter sp. DBS9H8]